MLSAFNIDLFLSKKIGFVPWPDIIMSQTIYYWQEIFILTLRQTVKSLHCLWLKSHNRTRGQFECDMTWFCFCFDFACSHARCGCCSIVCLCFQVVQIKQVDCKLSTKNMCNYKYKTFQINHRRYPDQCLIRWSVSSNQWRWWMIT